MGKTKFPSGWPITRPSNPVYGRTANPIDPSRSPELLGRIGRRRWQA